MVGNSTARNNRRRTCSDARCDSGSFFRASPLTSFFVLNLFPPSPSSRLPALPSAVYFRLHFRLSTAHPALAI